jgi:hypothetical protein
MASNEIDQCAGTIQLNIPPKEETEQQQNLTTPNDQQEEVKKVVGAHKRDRLEPVRRFSFRAMRKDQKKKLIFLSRQVFDIVKTFKCINGSEVIFSRHLDHRHNKQRTKEEKDGK